MAKKTGSAADDTTNLDPSEFEPKESNDEVDQVVSFPPYWKPLATANARGDYGKIRAKLIEYDDTDEENDIQRWILEATHRTLCWKGPAENQEAVIVEPGKHFSMSAYKQLRLMKYQGYVITLTALDKIDVPKGEMWTWKLTVDKATDALMTAKRQQIANGIVDRGAAPRLRP